MAVFEAGRRFIDRRGGCQSLTHERAAATSVIMIAVIIFDPSDAVKMFAPAQPADGSVVSPWFNASEGLQPA
jgi:hypothetical protein